MIRALRQLAARSRLHKVRKAYDAARTEYQAASIRQDTRRMHDATAPLQAAHRVLLAAEVAAKPIPYPMPRHGAAQEGN